MIPKYFIHSTEDIQESIACVDAEKTFEHELMYLLCWTKLVWTKLYLLDYSTLTLNLL